MYCGIDIGNRGAICFLSQSLKDIIVYDIPTISAKKGNKERKYMDFNKVFDILDKHNPECITFEDINAIFGVSKYTSFIMGFQKGSIESYCILRHKEYIKVKPHMWQRYIFSKYNIDIEIKENIKKGFSKINTKYYSIECAKRFITGKKIEYYKYINDKEKYYNKELKISNTKDGIADAINIALFTKEIKNK